jgi:hypothetical protein
MTLKHGRDPSAIRRLHDKTEPQPSGCWLYKGCMDQDGYGSFWLNGRMHRAHRVA